MIAISSMTLAEAVDEFQIRAGDALTNANLDWGTIVRYLSDARREVFGKTSGYKEWSYIRSVDGVTHLTPVPADFIRPVRVIVYSDEEEPGRKAEARQTDPREWETVAGAVARHSFVRATAIQPAYMVWSNGIQGDPTWAATMPAWWLAPTTVSAYVEYVAAYGDDLTTDASTLNVPVEMENLLINTALLRFLTDVNDQSRAQQLWGEVRSSYAKLRAEFSASLQTEAINLNALPNPEPADVKEVQ